MKMNVVGCEVARVMRSDAARGELADFARARKGCIHLLAVWILKRWEDIQTSSALRALTCSIFCGIWIIGGVLLGLLLYGNGPPFEMELLDVVGANSSARLRSSLV